MSRKEAKPCLRKAGAKNPPNPLLKGESHLCRHLELTIEGYFFYIKSQKNLNS